MQVIISITQERGNKRIENGLQAYSCQQLLENDMKPTGKTMSLLSPRK